MRTCVVVPVRIDGGQEYVWRWRASKAGLESQYCYALFYECVQDAERRGLTVDMPATLDQARRPEQISADHYHPAPTDAYEPPFGCSPVSPPMSNPG